MAMEHAGRGARSATAARPARVGLLGPVTASVDGRTCAPTARRQRAVLAYLALHPGEAVSADRLLDAIWGDDLPDTGGRAVAFQISKLRSVLEPDRTGEGALIVTTSAGYALDVDRDDVDAHRCRRLVDEARSSLSTDPAAAERLGADALSLWRGRPLADLGDERFVDDEIHRLDQLRLLARRTVIEARLALGRHVEVVGDLETLVGEHPLEESLAELLMTALHRCGRTADALRVYGELRIRLAEELGIEPSGALQATERRLVVGSEESPLGDGARSAARPFPVPITSLVGRDDEVDEIASAITSTRLVTLCGFGGLGKTRLAIEVAMRHTEPFGERWFVDLTAVESPASLADALVAAGGVSGPRLDPVERLLSYLAEAERLLVVIDNCEHLVDALAELVATILAAAPRVSVLATSRVALGIPGEMVWLVAPLAREANVELFTDRARLARPGFVVDDANRADVELLCRRLDGIPLAIELATARLSTMSVGQVADHLDDGLGLLTSPHRHRADRHSSVAAVLEWSYRLLDDADQALLQRLSVCVGGFDLDAATAIARPGDGASPADVLDRLGHLVATALVVFEDREGVPRYRMLDTVRHFAQEQLDADGPDARRSAALAHATHYAHVADTMRALAWQDHAEFLRLGDREVGNVRTAIEWSFAEGFPRVGLRIALGTWHWFSARLLWRAKRYVRTGVELLDDDSVEVWEAAALSLIDESSDFDLDYRAAACAIVERGLESTDDPALRSTLLRGLAASHSATDPRTAERYERRAIEERPVPAPTTLAAIHNRISEAAISGHLDDEDVLRRRLREVLAESPSPAAEAGIEATIAAAAGRWDDVLRIVRTADDLVELDQFMRFDVDASHLQALLALDRADEADTLLRRFQDEDEDDGTGQPQLVWLILMVAPVHLARDEPGAAVRALDEAVGLIGRDPRRLAIAVPAVSMLAVAAHQLGQHETAAVLFGFVAAEQDRLDIVPRPCDRPRTERAVSACRDALGEARFDELAAQGAGMEFRDLPRVELAADGAS